MVTINPFKALRPEPQHARSVASRPYDVLSRKEAKTEAEGNPNSFLHITRSEIDLPDETDVYAPTVYEKAKENLDALSRNILFRENKSCYYIYRLVMNEISQTGLICCSSLDDYDNDLIKKHELTRPDKENDRINHIKTTHAQTGNVFIAYKSVPEIDKLIEKRKERSPVYDFVADDGIQHTVWIVNDQEAITRITSLFKKKVPATYIADGHHRAASAAKARVFFENSTEAAMFLTTLFPSNEVRIMDYNRVVKDLNGNTMDEFFSKISAEFHIEASAVAVKPAEPYTYGMYVDKTWYKLSTKNPPQTNDPVERLDISVLQEKILHPILGIADQRTDKRIDFIGGIRGMEALVEKVDSGEMVVAFSIHPVHIQQLFDIADSGQLMPPKTTWFEPKLRDGLLTHIISP